MADKADKVAESHAAKSAILKVAAKGAENLVGGLEGLTLPKGGIRRDLWALSELLLRDRRLLGTLYFCEFSGMPILTRSLRDALIVDFPQCAWSELSMGMTDDYPVAVEEGATLVRIGRAIFGPRDTH